MADPERYAFEAFISYRHLARDRTWARWLHGALESYRVPAALVRGRGLRARLGRVFRDEEELAASSSLSAEIDEALKASRHLIVVCSRDTPASRWVNEEIVRFRQLGRQQRIRALLVDGEPQESFPAALYQLLNDGAPAAPGTGNAATPSAEEPLAADVRPQEGESARVTKRLALLRLAAPMLGCRFDDLRQRDNERAMRRLRQIVAAAVAAVAVVGALAAVAVVQRNRATQRLQEMLTERGREEWLRGDAARALPSLAGAYDLAPESTGLRFMLAQAVARVVPRLSLPSDGGLHAPHPMASEDGTRLTVVGAADRVSVWDLAGPRRVSVLGDEGAAFAGATRDGRHVLTRDPGGTVMRWETGSGRRTAVIGPLGGRLEAIRLSDDASRLVAVHEDGRVEAWDVAPARRVHEWRPEEARPASDRLPPVWDAGFSPDGARIVSVASEGMVRIWDSRTAAPVASIDTTARTARPLSKYRYKQGAVTLTAFSPDGALLATLTQEGTACLWDAATGSYRGAIAPASLPVVNAAGDTAHPVIFSLEFSADGRTVLASAGTFFHLWDVQTRTAGASVPVGLGDRTRLSRSGKRVVIAGDDGLKVWDADAGRIVGKFETRARSASFSPDDQGVISVDRDATVKLWPLDTVLPVVLRGHKKAIHSIEFSPDSRRIITASADKMAKVWEAGSGRLVTTAALHDEEAIGATFSPEGTRVVTIGLDGRATITRPDADVDIGNLVPPEGGPDTVAARFVEGGRQIVTLGRDRAVRVWGAASGAQQFQLPGKAPYCDPMIAFSPDGRRAFTVDNEQAKVWNTADGVLVSTLPGEAPHCAAFSPDGGRLLTGRERVDAPARLWDSADGRLISSFKESGGHAWIVAFSPDGRVVATAFAPTGVSAWDVESGRLVAELDTGREVKAISFSGDGSILVTAGDGGARLWDHGRGVLLAAFAEDASLVSAVLSPDGTRLATAGDGGHAVVWPIASGNPSPAEVRRVLACYVPWVLRNGALVSRAPAPAECSASAAPAAAGSP